MTPDPISGPALASLLREQRLHGPSLSDVLKQAANPLDGTVPEDLATKAIAIDCVRAGMQRAECRWRGEELPFIHCSQDQRITFNQSYFETFGNRIVVVGTIVELLRGGHDVTIEAARRTHTEEQAVRGTLHVDIVAPMVREFLKQRP